MPKRSSEEMRGGDGGGETIESVKDYYGKVILLREHTILLLTRCKLIPGATNANLSLLCRPGPCWWSPSFAGQVLATTKDLKTSACTAGGKPHARIIDIINTIPNEVNEKFYGCGAPLPMV